MRRRLRPMPTQSELDELYAIPHQHDRWADHRVRVAVTIAMAQQMVRPGSTVADLSCGDAAIVRELVRTHGVRPVLGDYAPGYELTGPIQDTIHQIGPVDLFICSETIEHVDDPDSVLAAIRPKTSLMILSTPDGEDNDHNPEHVWGWDAEAVRKMLVAAGFVVDVHCTLDLRPAGYVYSYQIWACR